MSGFALKLIAALAMLTDHIGAVLFPQYIVLRYIGRIAFPIYCFLLVEGYEYTHSVCKYLRRLGLFALISEIPFDLAFRRTVFEWDDQNVFCTLFLGLLGIYLYQKLLCRLPVKWQFTAWLPFAAAAVTAEYLHTDYGAFGVIIIWAFYVFRKKRVALFVFTGITYWVMTKIELFALCAYFPIFFYNGKRGPDRRWIQYGFYVFYPAHLLLLSGIRALS